jgi:hypothetical protein
VVLAPDPDEEADVAPDGTLPILKRCGGEEVREGDLFGITDDRGR